MDEQLYDIYINDRIQNSWWHDFWGCINKVEERSKWRQSVYNSVDESNQLEILFINSIKELIKTAQILEYKLEEKLNK